MKQNKENKIRQIIRNILKEEYLDNLLNKVEDKRLVRAKRIKSEYYKLSHRTGSKRIRTVMFKSYDPQGSGNKHIQRIQIPDLREIIRQKKNQTLSEAIETSIKAGNINIGCSCSDFRWRGYEWMADTGDYGITKQNIAPEINNPNLEGSTCKHIAAVFENIDSFIPKITEDLREYLKRRRKK